MTNPTAAQINYINDLRENWLLIEGHHIDRAKAVLIELLPEQVIDIAAKQAGAGLEDDERRAAEKAKRHELAREISDEEYDAWETEAIARYSEDIQQRLENLAAKQNALIEKQPESKAEASEMIDQLKGHGAIEFMVNFDVAYAKRNRSLINLFS